MSAEKGRPTGCNCRASDINFPYNQESMPYLILPPLSDDRNSRKSRNHLSRTRIFRFLPMLTVIGPKRLGIGIITLGHGVTQTRHLLCILTNATTYKQDVRQGTLAKNLQ